MNKERLLLVADAIEKSSVRGLGFNMAAYFGYGWIYRDRSGHDCKTTACVAGWTVAVMEDCKDVTGDGTGVAYLRLRDAYDFPSVAAALYLDLTHHQAHALFLEYDTAAWITPAVAARCLRVFAETEQIDYRAARDYADAAVERAACGVAS